MARKRHPIPRASTTRIHKQQLLTELRRIENNSERQERILRLERRFRERVEAANRSLPSRTSSFGKFRTSPYVLLMYASQKSFTRISEISEVIVPAKAFSSLETSAGKMVEELSLPEFGWEKVPSEMQTPFSALDGIRRASDRLHVATLKSGPRCLNDEMSENFADAILSHGPTWACQYQLNHVEFSYAALYGTTKESNKKDWHIARQICEKVRTTDGCEVIEEAANKWGCSVDIKGVRIDFHVRIGQAWWNHLSGYEHGIVDILVPLIRACVHPGREDAPDTSYDIRDLAAITSLNDGGTYNSALLQRSQLPWLMLMARHFCDELV